MAKERFTFRADGSLLAAVDSLIGTYGEDRSAVVVTLLRDGVIGAIGGNAMNASDEKLTVLENILTDIRKRLTNIEKTAAQQPHKGKHPPVRPPKPIEVGAVLLKSDAAIAAGYPGARGGLSPWCKVRGFDNSEAWLVSMGWEKIGGYRWKYVG